MQATPEESVAILLKFLVPALGYLAMSMLKQRKVLLRILKAFVAAIRQGEKRATQETPAIAVGNGNGHFQQSTLMNIENLMARIEDTETDLETSNRTLSSRIDAERKERLAAEMTASGEFAKLTLRLETYRRDNAKDIVDQTDSLKRYVDDTMRAIRTDMRQNFDDVKQMLRDLAA